MTALMQNYAPQPIQFVSGNGAWLNDASGNTYLDALGGIAVNILGHNHPALTAAIKAAADRPLHVSNLYEIPEQQALGSKLCELAGMERAFFCNSGAEANEAAIKLARLLGNQRGYAVPNIIVASGSFHGRTMATLSATGNQAVKQGFSPLLSGFTEVPFNDLHAISDAIAQAPETIAVMVEPIQGEGGIRIPDEGYLAGLRELCDQHDLLLIFDEIQTGVGRTGEWFAWQHENARPDILTSAKALGNGLPIGACMAQGTAAALFTPGSHGSTFGGNPFVCSAALAVLTTVDAAGGSAKAAELGQTLLDSFKAAFADLPAVTDIRGKGLMLAIELDRPCPELVALAREEGLLINVTAQRVIRLLPPMILDASECTEITERLTVALNKFLG